MLVNKERDLWERTVRNISTDIQLKQKHKELIKKLEVKTVIFKVMREAALKQKKTLQTEIETI